MSLLKLFFVTDLHGSTVCFRKFINAVLWSKPPDFLILGGDISGKSVIPLIRQEDGQFTIPLNGELQSLSADEVVHFKTQAEDRGAYIYECSTEDWKHFTYSAVEQQRVAQALQERRLTEWLVYARERLSKTKTRLIVNCGNDDDFFLDEIIESFPPIIFPEGKAIALDADLTLLSVGYSNTTPWHCKRELTEPELRERIDLIVRRAPKSENCIFNFHCPPINTALDLAPKLDGKLRPSLGIDGVVMHHYGSVAVREAILKFNPLLSLHGHIHEQHVIEKLGVTVCVNPGTAYWTGSLQGVVATFDAGRLVGVHLTSERYSLESEKRWQTLCDLVIAALPSSINRMIMVLKKRPKSDAFEEQQELFERHREAAEEKLNRILSLLERRDAFEANLHLDVEKKDNPDG